VFRAWKDCSIGCVMSLLSRASRAYREGDIANLWGMIMGALEVGRARQRELLAEV